MLQLQINKSLNKQNFPQSTCHLASLQDISCPLQKYSQNIFLLIHSICHLHISSGHFNVTLSLNTPIQLYSLSPLMSYSSNRDNV